MNPLLVHEQTLIRAGHQSFFGAFAQQSPSAFLSFNRLLNAHNFDTIIELGTHDAGLSTMFALYAYLSKEPAVSANPAEPVLYKNRTHHRKPKTFHTFDYVIRDETAIKALTHLGACFHRADTLDDIFTIDAIRSLIEDPASGPTLLLCDGGNKKKELDLYADSLKPGDFVMLHDWAYDEVAFERNKCEGIWHCWESRWENGPDILRDQFGIKDICETYGIEPIYAEEFDKVAWFCGRKK